MKPAGHMCLLERIEPLEIHGINEGPWVRAHEGHMIPLGTYVVSGRLHEEVDAADARAHSRRKRHKYSFFKSFKYVNDSRLTLTQSGSPQAHVDDWLQPVETR